jgi:hypothetical protein
LVSESCPTAGGLPRVLGGVPARPTKPPDAESAACPNGFSGSGAPNQDRGAIIFPERTWSCPEDALLGAVIKKLLTFL